ncbi:MAG: PAS domain-containing protein [Gemmatimonadetes bacterium]|nr:PAS domain-containing protein [Gemmatimonadota bacterium]
MQAPKAEDAAQPELRDFARLFEVAFEDSTAPRALLCADGTFLRANGRFGEFLGVAPEALTGCALGDFAHPDDRARLAALADGTAHRIEARFRCLDGRERVGELASHSVRHRDGGAPFLTVELHDATERVEAIAALRESEARLALALECSGMGLWDWNIESGSLFFSDAWAAAFGYGDATRHHSYDTWRDRVHPDDLPALTEILTHHLRGKSDFFRAEHRLRRADGTWAWIDARGRIVQHGERGAPRRMVGTMYDVTARRQAEEEQRTLETQMLRAQKLESLGVLAGGIAHDFNNLLTTILGNANLARAMVGEESEIADLLADVEAGAVRAAELTRQLLAYAGKGRFVVQPVDLSALVREMTALLHTAVSKRARLDLQLAQHLLTISADPSQMRQVVMNLVTNASDALGDDDGVISIRTGIVRHYSTPGGRESTSLPDHFVYLDVEDTGVGMDEATRTRMFEPFFTTKRGARGLGLPATRGIVQGHEGTIRVTSAPGHGTTIRLLFPASAVLPVERAPKERAPDAWRGSGTVLVVDDEEGVRTVAQRLLTRLGFTVLQAVDGVDALHLYESHRNEIVLVVLDLTMPRMGGAETLAELRRRNRTLPVVVTSGYSESELGAPPDGSAAVGFVQKPFARTVLVKALREALDD